MRRNNMGPFELGFVVWWAGVLLIAVLLVVIDW